MKKKEKKTISCSGDGNVDGYKKIWISPYLTFCYNYMQMSQFFTWKNRFPLGSWDKWIICIVYKYSRDDNNNSSRRKKSKLERMMNWFLLSQFSIQKKRNPTRKYRWGCDFWWLKCEDWRFFVVLVNCGR